MTKIKTRIVISGLLSMMLLPLGSFAQTGPGGVGTPATVAFWMDAESEAGINYVNGANVNDITDYSAAGINAMQPDVTRQPEFQTNVINGRAALFFNGTANMLTAGNSALDGATFIDSYVYGDVSYSGVTIPFSLDYGNGNFDDFLGLVTLSGTIRAFGRNGATGTGAVRANIGSPAGFNLFENVKSGTTVTGRVNYATVGSVTASTASPTPHVGVRLGGRDLANAGAALRMTGHIAESFVFTAALNTAEQNILENYMAAKYGSTVTVDMYDFESSYGLGVIGIGREDASNEHTNSIGNGIVRIEKAGGFAGNGEYLFIGHDGASTSALSTNVATGSRFERIWRMDEPTDVGGIDITFQLDATNNFSADPTSYQLLIDTDTDFSIVSSSVPGVYDAINQTVTFSNVDMNAGDFFTLTGDSPAIIESIIPFGLWDAPTTWSCGCVPTSFNDVTIKSSHLVIVPGDESAKGLTIESGAVMTFTAGGKLTLSEDLVINGSVSSVLDGEIVMGGVSAQNIDLNAQNITLSRLTIDNFAGVTLLNGIISINDELTPLNGDLDVSAAGLTILSSSATTTARVGEFNPNSSVTGNVTVERFISAGIAGNRNIASPVIGADLSEWDADILISGTGFPDGCAYGTTPNSTGCYFSAKKFQGGDLGTDFIDVTNPSEPLTNLDGFELFLGDDLTSFSGATLKSTGSLNTFSDITTSSAPTDWNLIGNPYASPMSFQNVGRTRTGNYFYVFDANSGSYQWYDGSSNTSSIGSLADGNIAIGQGIWVFVTGSPNSLTFKQTDKISTNATFIRDYEVENGLQLTLSQDNSTFYNVTSLSFNDNADDYYDELDIPYFSTGLETASSLYIQINDSVQLAKNYLYSDGQKKVVDFKMNCKTDSYYTITPSNLEDIQDYANVYVFDKLLNLMVDLRKEGAYTFYATEGVTDRFSVILSNNVLSDKTYISGNEIESTDVISIKQLGHSVEIQSTAGFENASVDITNVLGQTVVSGYALSNSSEKQYLTMENSHSGIFIVVVKSGAQIVATKKIIL